MSLVVVNLGLPKSGTTTLARALRRSGMRVADHRIRGKQTKDAALKDAYVGELLYQGFYEAGDPAARIPTFTAIAEMSVLRQGRSVWPQMDYALISAIKAHHPGVKFLASRRDAFAMSQSMLGWSDLGTARLPQNDIPGLPAGYGETSKQREQWINGHYATLCQLFKNCDDFLEYDVSDDTAPQKIATFLGRKMPWWGKLNTSPVPKSLRSA
ncbi:MAG: hypothetical protein ACI92Z_002945 [Paracoccaceae bacterium]|jgi:hypothetical protein